MYVIQPVTAINPVVSGSGSGYYYPAWVSGTKYAAGEVVCDTTAVADFMCRWAVAGSTAPASDPIHWQRLTLNGFARQTAGSYASNFAVSLYPTWSVGVFKLGDRVYDSVALKDYQAMAAIGSSFTSRPSVAVASEDPTIAALWMEIGQSNLWAAFDQETLSQAVASSVGWMTIDVVGAHDRLAFANVGQCSGIVVKRIGPTAVPTSATPSPGDVLATYSLDMTMAGVSTLHNVASVAVTAVTTSARYHIAFTAASGFSSVAVGKIVAGSAVSLGSTKVEPTISIRDYSRKEQDDTFGTATFIRRGYSKTISAQLVVTHTDSDRVAQVASDLRGQPVFWDFNNSDQQYRRLMVFGFYQEFSAVLAGIADDIHTLQVAGLVE